MLFRSFVGCEEVALPGGLGLGVLSRKPVVGFCDGRVNLDLVETAMGDFTLVVAPTGGVGDVVSGLPTPIFCINPFPAVRPIDQDNGEFRPMLLLGRLWMLPVLDDLTCLPIESSTMLSLD